MTTRVILPFILGFLLLVPIISRLEPDTASTNTPLCLPFEILLRPWIECLFTNIDNLFRFILEDLFIYLCDNTVRVDFFNGPKFISGSSVTYVPEANLTMEDIHYYNYFTAAAYCVVTVSSGSPLSCCFCSKISDGISYHTIIQSQDSDARALVAVNPSRKEIIIAFRGTVNFVQALYDFNSVYTFYGNGNTTTQMGFNNGILAHSGFLLLTRTLFSVMITVLESLLSQHPGYTVVLAGHSLGGAMASLSCFFIHYSMLPEPEIFPELQTAGGFKLVTFGQPRVGNRQYADFMNELGIPMARVVNKADIVPHFVRVATYLITEGNFSLQAYAHHSQEIWTADDDSFPPIYCNNKVFEDWNCSNSINATELKMRDHMYYLDVDYSVCMVEDVRSTFIDTLYGVGIYAAGGVIPGLTSGFVG